MRTDRKQSDLIFSAPAGVQFIIFLVSKFRQLEMQSIESVAIETYYTINLYSINMKEFVPVSVRDQVNNELFFTTLPKEKFLILLKSVKKKIKKYIRKKFSSIGNISS